MSKIVPCLWFDGQAEEAAEFYVSLFPDSRIRGITRAPVDNPGSSEGAVLIVEFTLGGQDFMGLNGGTAFKFTEAVSFSVRCEDQAEVDRLWDALIADGGAPSECGWLKDRFGLSWQITPAVLFGMIQDDDRAAAGRAFMAIMTMSKLDIAELEQAFKSEDG